MGIDPAYGSSAFGIVVTEWADGIVQIMHAEEYYRPDYNEMLSTVYGLMSKYNVDSVYIDGANPSFISNTVEPYIRGDYTTAKEELAG